jgi:hypothetical protein
MQYEYDLKYREVGRGTDLDLIAWLNARGAIGWRVVDIDAEGSRVIFEREIAVNDKIRAEQLKEGEDASRSDQDSKEVR